MYIIEEKESFDEAGPSNRFISLKEAYQHINHYTRSLQFLIAYPNPMRPTDRKIC